MDSFEHEVSCQIPVLYIFVYINTRSTGKMLKSFTKTTIIRFRAQCLSVIRKDSEENYKVKTYVKMEESRNI